MARRGLWLIGGVAVGLGALVLKPDARTWLRRRLGMQPEDRRWFEEDEGGPAEQEGDEPLDTREARFSLRARLAEETLAEVAPERPPLAAAPPLSPPDATPAPHAPAFGSTPPVAVPDPDPEPPAAPPETVVAVAEPTAVPEPAVWAAPEPDAEAPAAAEPAVDDDAGDALPEEAPAAAPETGAEQAPAARWVTAAPEPERPAGPTHVSALDSVPPIGREDDAPTTPDEDTSEIEPLPAVEARQAPETAPPPPIPLRPPTAPAAPASRPFSESTSFRSAIDAARERVHGVAREATPDEGESTEPLDEGE